MCAPILLIGAIWLVPRLRHPSKDPNAVISLTVESKPSIQKNNPQHPTLNFAWEATATGGPEYGYRIGFREKIVAITPSRRFVVYSNPPIFFSSLGGGSTGSSNSSFNPGQSAITQHNLSMVADKVPLGAQLQWEGEIVAVPRREADYVVDYASAAQIAQWSRIKGAAHVKKTFVIPYETNQNAVWKFSQEPVNATNAAQGVDTCIAVEARDLKRRVYPRLVAFDGKTRRVLWDYNESGRNSYWKGILSEWRQPIKRDVFLFQLAKVPASWGEITFLWDTVYSDQLPETGEEYVDLGTIEKWKKAGGIGFSKRVVLRAAQ